MEGSILGHVDFAFSELPPMGMLNRYLSEWVLENAIRVKERDTDFEGIGLWVEI